MFGKYNGFVSKARVSVFLNACIFFSSKSLMAKLVCHVSERNCMLYRCEKCPGSDSLTENTFRVQSVFLERSIEEDDELTFK